jgi:hypothetical protein
MPCDISRSILILNFGVNVEIFGWKMKGGKTAGKT